jgi:hypothetical protein
MALFLTTYFLYDDIKEDAQEHEADKMLRLLTNDLHIGLGETDAFAVLNSKIGTRLKAMPSTWKEEYAAGMRRYFDSIGDETLLIQKMNSVRAHPSVDAYWRWRRPNIGGEVLMLFAEVDEDNQLPGSWAQEPIIKEIYSAWDVIMMCQNDLASAKGGRDIGRLNLAFAIAGDFEMDDAAALNVLVAIHDGAVRRLDGLFSKLADRSAGDQNVARWTDACKQVVVGCATWHDQCGRYQAVRACYA